MKKGVVAGFAAFLIFMAICTLIAKGIYKSGLARVTVCSPEERKITRKITAAGYVQPGQETGIYVQPGLRVSAVSARVGKRVAAGEALFAVDLRDLGERIREAEEGCAYLEAQIRDIAQQEKERDAEKELAAKRLAEDYDSLVREQNLRIRACQLNADLAGIRFYDTASGEGSVSGSDLEAALLKVEYEKALNAVEEAKLQKEETLRDWERSLEEARGRKGAASAQTVKLQGELDLAKYALEQLRELEQQGGVIYAGRDMVVQSCMVQIGERTTDRACMIGSSAEEVGEIQAVVGEKDASLLSVGGRVTLKYTAESSESSVITYISPEGERRTLWIAVPQLSAMLPGQTVEIEAWHRSDAYDFVIPSDALSSEGAVYIVERREGILGTEDKVRKVPVFVQLEGDDGFVAVTSPFLPKQSMIVKSSSRQLQEGDAVRVMEED